MTAGQVLLARLDHILLDVMTVEDETMDAGLDFVTRYKEMGADVSEMTKEDFVMEIYRRFGG